MYDVSKYERPPAPGIVTVLKIFASLFLIAALPAAAFAGDHDPDAGIGAFLEAVLAGTLLFAAAAAIRKLNEIELHLRLRDQRQ